MVMTDFSDCINYIDRVKVEFHSRFRYLLQSLARLESQLNASSAGRTTGAAPLSPPIRCNSGSRQPLRSPALNGLYGVSSTAPSAGGLPAHHKTQRGQLEHNRVDSVSLFKPSGPSGSPYPPVRYEWEEWE